MKIPSGLPAAVEYSLHACDRGTSPAHAHIGFFDSLKMYVMWVEWHVESEPLKGTFRQADVMKEVAMRRTGAVIGLPRGYCRICGLERELTEDHVPPKRGGNVGSVVVTCGGHQTWSQNGIYFRTICVDCNSQVLGLEADKEYSRVFKEAEGYARYLSVYPKGIIDVGANGHLFLKSILGHLLAASVPDNDVESLKKPLDYSPFFETIRQFVLGRGVLGDRIICNYWFYGSEVTRLNQYFLNSPDFINHPKLHVMGSTFKAFPFGFWIVDLKASTIAPRGFMTLPDKPDVVLKLDVNNKRHESFPEAPTDTGVVLTSGNSSIVGKKRSPKRTAPT